MGMRIDVFGCIPDLLIDITQRLGNLTVPRSGCVCLALAGVSSQDTLSVSTTT